MLEIYSMNNDVPKFKLPLSEIMIFLGRSKLILKCGQDLFRCNNNIAKELCMKLAIVPKKMYQLTGPNYMNKQLSQLQFADVLCWIDNGKFYLYNVSTDKIIAIYENNEVERSSKFPNVMVLNDSLMKTTEHLEFLDINRNPRNSFSEEEFPLFFKREGTNIALFVPNNMIYGDTIKNLYEKKTRQVGNNIKISDLNGKNIIMSTHAYKSLFKESMYEVKLPFIQNIHTEKLLVSRARNISDLLLFEFFGQWQIILDYVNSKMKKDSFSEEEITSSDYTYICKFQHRKRMEELVSKFPQFMWGYIKQLTIDPKLNKIYQQQQKEMFQVAGQLKSQFIEIENLLSQITYIHFNNDEYQKRLKEAQLDASRKKIRGSHCSWNWRYHCYRGNRFNYSCDGFNG